MIVRSDHALGVLHLRLHGTDALDTLVASRVKAEALSLIGRDSDVVVDLSGISFVDSTGIGVLVSLFKAARKNGRDARFAGIAPGVKTVLEIIKLDRIFEVYPDAAAAAAALKRHRSSPSVSR
jgi:anti-sigma B factor antagonist